MVLNSARRSLPGDRTQSEYCAYSLTSCNLMLEPCALERPTMTDSHVLVFTDIVDSTRLTAQLGDQAWSALWESHDRAARALLRTWRGREIAKADGFVLLFHSTSDAANFSVAYHRALAQLPVPLLARVGVHTGPVLFRENSGVEIGLGAPSKEADGIAIPVAARMMSLALGGQTLLSGPATAALDRDLFRLFGHGHWRFKGLQEPVEVFELGDERTPFRPPPDFAKGYRVVRRAGLWQPVRDVRHTLPADRDAFVGRQAALHELAQRFDSGARLVTLSGIGGTGKTRMAQRFGRLWLGDFSGGVWFCDLSRARGLDGIVHAVAQGLDLPLGNADPVQQIGNAIAGRDRCLVVLDNFEQVARYAEATLGAWMDRSTDACFLVTSREVLGIVGEQGVALPPLPLNEGTDLFLKRATAAAGALSQEDQAAIEPLVRLLDSLPLAIELAAARAPVLRPPALLQRMNDRFKLLTLGGGRHDRQATMRATLDWSWDLLDHPEKVALGQLSVFEGGFTLEAAEALLDLSACENAPWTLDVVQSLVQKSFVRSVRSDRFEMLRSVQEYAAEHLSIEGRFIGSGPRASTSAQARHWHYFARLDARAAVANIDNLVAACRRAVAHADADAAVGALSGAWAALKLVGPFRVALELAEQVGNMGRLSLLHQATVNLVVGSALHLMGNLPMARERFESGLSQALTTGDHRSEALLRCHLGELFTTLGVVEQAREYLQQALALARGLDDKALQCSVLNSQGALASALGSLDDSRANYESALSLAYAIEDDHWAGGLHGNLGALCHDKGMLDEALHHYLQALTLTERVGDRRWAGNTHCNLGLLYHDLGRAADAQAQFEAALATAREMAHSRLESAVLCNLGIAFESQGRFDQALAHYQGAVALATKLGQKRSEGQFRTYLGRLYARTGHVADAKACLDVGETLLTEAGDRIGLGLLLCARAETELAASDIQAVRTLITRIGTLTDDSVTATPSELAREFNRVRALADAACELRT